MVEKLFDWFCMGLMFGLGFELIGALMTFLHIPCGCGVIH